MYIDGEQHGYKHSVYVEITIKPFYISLFYMDLNEAGAGSTGG